MEGREYKKVERIPEETKVIEDWREKPSEDRLEETELLLKIHGIEEWNKNQIDIVARIIMLAEYNAKHPKLQSGEREETKKKVFGLGSIV